MNLYYLKANALVATAAAPVVTGSAGYRKMDTGTKIFFWLAVLNFMEEALAYYCAVHYHNNLVVYNVATVTELFLISLYFNYTIPWFRKHRIGILIGCMSILMGILNNVLVQSVHDINTYYLFYQAIVIISMSMTSLSVYMKSDSPGLILKEVHFWIPVTMIFFSSITYLLYSVIKYYAVSIDAAAPEIVWLLFFVSAANNLVIATIFLVYPKLFTHARS